MKLIWYGKWLLAGLLTGFALLTSFGWLLVIIGLALQLRLLLANVSLRNVFLGAWLAGTVHMLVALSWGWSTVQLLQLGLFPKAQFFWIAFVWLSSSIVIALGYAFFLSLLWYVTEGRKKWFFVGFPPAVLLGEICGRLLFSLYTIGDFGGLNIAFGFGHLGFALASHELLRILAVFGGVYFLTLLSSSLAVLWVLFHHHYKWRWSVVFVLFITSYVIFPLNVPSEIASVGLITTEYALDDVSSIELESERQRAYSSAIAEAEELGLSTVILPEDSRYMYYGGYAGSMNVVDTSRVEGDSGPTLETQAYFYKNIFSHGKQHLVPFGEYVPVIHKLLMLSVGFSEQVDEAEEIYNYHPGDKLSNSTYPRSIPPVLFCYESIVPYAVKSMYTEADWPYVAHVVSHSWFSDPLGILKYQLAVMNSIQAVWSQTYILQSGNMAPVAIYGPFGQVRQYRIGESDTYKLVPVVDLVSGVY